MLRSCASAVRMEITRQPQAAIANTADLFSLGRNYCVSIV